MKIFLNIHDEDTVEAIEDIIDISGYPIKMFAGIYLDMSMVKTKSSAEERIKKALKEAYEEWELHYNNKYYYKDNKITVENYQGCVIISNDSQLVPNEIIDTRSLATPYPDYYDDILPINITSIYSVPQAILAFAAGAKYITIALNRFIVADGADHVMNTIKQIVKLSKGYNTKVMISDINNVQQFTDMALLGVDCVRIAPVLLTPIGLNRLTVDDLACQ